MLNLNPVSQPVEALKGALNADLKRGKSLLALSYFGPPANCWKRCIELPLYWLSDIIRGQNLLCCIVE